jgi:hypothetical protein
MMLDYGMLNAVISPVGKRWSFHYVRADGRIDGFHVQVNITCATYDMTASQ